MKEKLKVRRYTKIDKQFDIFIDLHQQIYSNSNLKNRLIYFDNNFSNYLKKSISNQKENSIYVLEINERIEGFIHFRLIKDILFLNNICLNNSLQGKRLGSRFLKESVNLTNIQEFQYFSLDVLASNNRAFNWYKNLGMEEVVRTPWCEITSFEINQKTKFETNIGKDPNGFNSIFKNEEKIATIINDKNIILHDINYFSSDLLTGYKSVVSNTKINKKNKLKFLAIDESVRMKGLLSDVTFSLNIKS